MAFDAIRTYTGRMLHRTYRDQDCSVARALEIVGERWTILILRDAFVGARRFDDFQRSLLHTRLRRLVNESAHPPRAPPENS